MKVVCDIRVYDDDGNLRFERNNFKVEPIAYKISEMVTEYGVNFKVWLADDICLHKQIKSPFEKCHKCRWGQLYDADGQHCQLDNRKNAENCNLFEGEDE